VRIDETRVRAVEIEAAMFQGLHAMLRKSAMIRSFRACTAFMSARAPVTLSPKRPACCA